jgi:hypothetical protein
VKECRWGSRHAAALCPLSPDAPRRCVCLVARLPCTADMVDLGWHQKGALLEGQSLWPPGVPSHQSEGPYKPRALLSLASLPHFLHGAYV